MENYSIKEKGWRIKHLIFGFSIGVIASYMLLSFHYASNESALMLAVFNFLFVSLIFPLNGSLKTKASMLLLGNIIGFIWNDLFFLFAYSVTRCVGESFNTLHMILSPMLNLVWIVSFWSISLTALANSKKEGRGRGN